MGNAQRVILGCCVVTLGCTGRDTVPATESVLEVRVPFAAPPDSLDGSNVESCAVYGAERCTEGTLERCGVYNSASLAFESPPLFLERALSYDRWYDLHHSPHGQVVERLFSGPMPGDVPETEWSSADNFAAACCAVSGGEAAPTLWERLAVTKASASGGKHVPLLLQAWYVRMPPSWAGGVEAPSPRRAGILMLILPPYSLTLPTYLSVRNWGLG